MTLEEFNSSVVTPMILRWVEAGKLDNAILDPDCAEFIFDPEIGPAIRARLEAISDE